MEQEQAPLKKNKIVGKPTLNLLAASRQPDTSQSKETASLPSVKSLQQLQKVKSRSNNELSATQSDSIILKFRSASYLPALKGPIEKQKKTIDDANPYAIDTSFNINLTSTPERDKIPGKIWR